MTSETPTTDVPPTAAPSDTAADASHDAVYFDGKSNRKRKVTLRFTASLGIVENGVTLASWPYDQIRRTDGPPGRLRLRSLTAPPLARLELAEGMMSQALIARCTAIDAERGPRQTGRIVLWSLGAIASILAIAIFGIPLAADRLAPLVPHAFEARLGATVEKQLRFIVEGETCQGAEGRAAFAKLVDTLKQAGSMEQPIEANVLSSSTRNAFALPGGKIYILNGLLQRARTPDELAGVLAHELGHVKHRDSMRKLIQTGGTSFLVGLLLGDVTGGAAVIFAARTMLDSSYSREAERAADTFAVAVMHKLGRSPRPMGEFLFRITGAQEGKGISILSSHPLTEERLETMKKEDRPITGAELLTAAEWQALKSICGAPRSDTPRSETPQAKTPQAKTPRPETPRSSTPGSDGGKP